MSTPLHQRMLAFNYGDDERAELMREVWSGHSWMVDAYTGNYDTGEQREILLWCYDTFGDQASPIHGKPGTWYRGSATVNGWTWFGFSTEVEMLRFAARWRTAEPCEYCGPGKSTGLPGNTCENCMNTGLKNPTAEDLK